MTTSFEKYSDILLEAFQSSARSDDLASKKKEILDELFNFFEVRPSNVLFVGFSPGILKVTEQKIFVTQVSDAVKDFLEEKGVNFTFVDFEIGRAHV